MLAAQRLQGTDNTSLEAWVGTLGPQLCDSGSHGALWHSVSAVQTVGWWML